MDKFGNKKWMQTTLTPVIDFTGNLLKIVAIDSDITKIKLAEKEINTQKESLELQNEKIEIQNQHINSSISYAKDIQQAILPLQKNLAKHFNHFVLYQPKDVVSGDLYWFSAIDKYIFITVINCTKHDVPKAFMSLIADRLISSIVNERHIFSPSSILMELEKGVIKALKQEQTDNKDGMDVAIVRIEKFKNSANVLFAGAKRPLIYYTKENSQIDSLKGDRFSIGGIKKRRSELNFTEQSINFEKGDILYLSSDGFVDQNNANRKRLGSERFLILLKEIASLPIGDQKTILQNVLKEFQKNEPQRDDITLLGIEI
jgi:serine phosphatase RsbU (regulator of sigma subunit)